MRLVHWDPFQELRREHDQEVRRDNEWAPPVDIFEKGDDLIIRAEVPGIERDALDVKIENDTLILAGERVRASDEEEGQAYRRERRYGGFARSFTLPKTVDATRISAEYKDGVLDIRIPKVELAKARQIEIKVG